MQYDSDSVSQILISGGENPVGPGWVSCPVLVQAAVTTELGLCRAPFQEWQVFPGHGEGESWRKGWEFLGQDLDLRRSSHL